MDFRLDKRFFIRLSGGLLRLLITYFLIPATLVFFILFDATLDLGSMLELAELSTLQYSSTLMLVSLIPLGISYWWQRDNRLLLWLCVSCLVLHVISLEYINSIPHLTIELTSERTLELQIVPSMLVMIVLIIFSIIHFLLPNQFTRPYLSLLPFFVLVSLYYQAIVPVFGGLVGILSADPTSQLSKADAMAFVIFSAEYIPISLLLYSVPLSVYLLARFWQPLTKLAVDKLCHLLRRRATKLETQQPD